jgi:hypothetical protein
MIRFALTVFAFVLFANPVSAEDKKPGGLRDFPFWSAPKQLHARAFVPGLQASLMLTPEQCAKIEAACQETIDLPENKGKNAPGAAAATEKLHKMVADILTDDQKKLIEKTNDAYARVVADVGEDFQPKFAMAKGNAEDTAKLRQESQEAIVETMNKKLDGVLSNDQLEAVKKLAEIEKKRAEEVKKKGK